MNKLRGYLEGVKAKYELLKDYEAAKEVLKDMPLDKIVERIKQIHAGIK